MVYSSTQYSAFVTVRRFALYSFRELATHGAAWDIYEEWRSSGQGLVDEQVQQRHALP